MSLENNTESKSTKNENSLINKKYTSPTIRLTLTLKEPDEESCSIFNYNQLIAEEKRKRRREKDENQTNGIEDGEEGYNDVKRLALHFEEKYGGVNVKKRKKKRAPKFYNYTDLAAGYDESDSFIDNSEAFDEALPDDLETAFGGYYVNTGQLELKKVKIIEENSDLDEIRLGKRKTCVLKSDDDSSSDGGAVRSDDNNSKTDDEDAESVNKKLPEETNHEEPGPVEPTGNGVETAKSALLKEKTNHTIKINGDLTVKKKKYKKRRTMDENPDEAPKQKKKTPTVKLMLEEKRIVENSRSSCETEKESHHDETLTAESVTTVVPNVSKTNTSEQVKLPDNLSAEVLELISQLQRCVNDSESSGARSLSKLSSSSKSSMNSKLLKLESQVRSMKSAARHALYEYLAQFLPCSKDTLMKRAKKLLIEEEERHVTEPLQKLKASVDKLMPTLADSYNAACQKLAEEKGMNDLKNGEIDEKKIIASKMPPKKFIWTEETRGYLRELVSCRVKCFHTLRPRKESAEDYVKKFLDTKVKPLWPTGWMETSILMKEAQCSNLLPKAKKAPGSSNSNGTAPEVDILPTTALMATATTTLTSVKKSSVSPVPNSVNHVNASPVGTNVAGYNFLANPLALSSLAVQHPTQTDVSYSCAQSTGIPHRSDLSILGSLNPPSVPDIMAHFVRLNSQCQISTTSAQPTYSKSISPPKKSTTPTPTYSTSRSTTTVSNAPPSSSSYPNKKKTSDTPSSKFNDSFKIDALISTSSKTKKEHSMLNHVSQYNKHYSHKTAKRKNNDKKEDHAAGRSIVNHSNGSNVSSSNSGVNGKTTSPNVVNSSNGGAPLKTEMNRKHGGRDLVLDLSPNKVKESKCDKLDNPLDSGAEISPVPSSSVTAKDHNYWAGASAREEEVIQDLQTQPRRSFLSPESNNSVNTSKTTHISRKQRLLQESVKSMAQPCTDSLSTNLVSLSENSSRRSESRATSNLPTIKIEEKSSSIFDRLEETPTTADLLSKIINDTLQNPLPFVKAEVKSEERVISPADFAQRPSSRDSLSSVGSLNAERKTPNSETADIIQDLVALNQIGGHSIPRRMDYHDSKKHNEFSNGSIMSQSSLHLSDKNKPSALPRMNISPFQNEFFKHIRNAKMTNEGSSSYTTNSKSQDNCFTSELPSLEVDNLFQMNRSNTALKQENSTAYNYQQSVIMPPASSRWYIPESKS